MSPAATLRAAMLAIAVLAAWPAAAQDAGEVPAGLGHPTDHETYFDGACCNKNDCEVIPDSAVTETANGWRVRYWTKNWGGRVVEGFVKRGSERMSKRCAPSGECTGACSYALPIPGKASVRCLYIMPSA